MSQLPDRLLKKKQVHDNKIKQQQEDKEKQEMFGCTFRPNILTSNAANQYYNNIQSFNSTIEKQNHVREKMKRDHMEAQCKVVEDMLANQFNFLT